MKILIVEDDERISEAIAEYLEDRNHVVEMAQDGQEAWELLDAFSYDAIVLDIGLPRIDGLTLCRRLRSQGCSIPILMLTARDTLPDKVQGLDVGADDYLVKPFEIEELAARVRALLRRRNDLQPPLLQWGELRLDPNCCDVSYGESPIKLSATEFRILELFLRHSRRVFTREQIIDQVWSFDRSPGEATVKAHIRSLRLKLEAVGASPDLIETVYGVGYRLGEINNSPVQK